MQASGNVSAKETTGREHTYVTMAIGGDMYGIDVMRVETVSGVNLIRTVPNSLPYMKGMMNLRSHIIPVVDMRIKFNLPSHEYSKNSVVVVIPVRDKRIGFLVDEVLDVTTLPKAEIQDPPHFAAADKTDFIEGIAKLGDSTVVIMNVDKIIADDELESISVN